MLKNGCPPARVLLGGLLPVLLGALLAAAPQAEEAAMQLPLRSIGPAGMSGRITAIEVLPSDRDTWYIGTASGGLWRTRDAGTHFEPLFDGQATQSIGAVAVAPSNPDVVYVGTGEGNPRNSQSSGNGVYRSRDGGRTWQHLGLEASRNIHRLIVDPHDEQRIWVGVLGDPFADSDTRGLYRSQDGGESWERVLYENARTGIAELVADPQNPRRLFAALWEFRRSPWDFQSGGPASGLFVSQDGGDSWRELGPEHGLPAKPYGRIGIAIAPSDRRRVYALVESAHNALYRSDDGGLSWRAMNDETIGSRPFYFAELHVDPRNENRVYNLYSRLARSEDGGQHFAVIEDWGREVHADYHAFWIDPDDSDFIIAGTDGGLYWTRDRGAHWRFAENLPLGQFYHVTVDRDQPYRIYGGLQDNGTWYGPSEVWNRGGLRNGYWRELAFNDGFDVALDAGDEETVYALWQAGMLLRVDVPTGQRKTIAPVSGDEALRFNWNAAIAADPATPGTLYIGSQYVHRSRDRGDSWTVISPDLTTNDAAKQRQTASGGLTIDATGAENHTTITAIAPGPHRDGVLWVATDDGRVHRTEDGGESWQELTSALAGLAPRHGAIRQIHLSSHTPGEAFLVIDNHLQGDRTPYLLHTTDYGDRWRNLFTSPDLPGPVLSIVQDPVEPDLLFAGTEGGLFLSLDGGAGWMRWRENYPAVATADLAIQRREKDLIVATFGRSLWILDDIQPWRELARDPRIRDRPLHLFAIPDAYQVVMDQARGQRLSPDHLFAGDNNAREALITFWVGDAETDSVEITVARNGKTVRRWDMPVRVGLNRSAWDQQLQGRAIYGPLMSPDLEKPFAVPGTYSVTLRAGTGTAAVVQEKSLELRPDPRIAFDRQVFTANLAYRQRIEQLEGDAQRLEEAARCMEAVLEHYEKNAVSAAAKTKTGTAVASIGHADGARAALRKDLDALWGLLAFPQQQGTISDSSRLLHRLGKAFYFTHTPYQPLSDNDRTLLASLERQSVATADAFAQLHDGAWSAWRRTHPGTVRCDAPAD